MRRLILSAVIGAAILAPAGCALDKAKDTGLGTYRTYCGDSNKKIIKPKLCDGTVDNTIIYISPREGMKEGERLNVLNIQEEILANDAEHRKEAGLPATGAITNGALVGE